MVFQIYSNASISFPYRSGMGLELICQDVHGPKLAEAVLAVGPDVFFFFSRYDRLSSTGAQLPGLYATGGPFRRATRRVEEGIGHLLNLGGL